jgi:uncharacterized protein YdhG (YjbR/CyaY superfamily)
MAEKAQPKRRAKPSFTPEERAAMRERARELKAEAAGVAGEKDALAKIKEMPPGDRKIAKRIHELVKAAAPGLTARTWYGMPAYAMDGKVVCFFQSSHRFKVRYSTFGFSDRAKLDKGAMWPTSYALTELTAADEAKITRLVKQAVR